MQRPQFRAEDNPGWQRAGRKVGVLPSIPPNMQLSAKSQSWLLHKLGHGRFLLLPTGQAAWHL